LFVNETAARRIWLASSNRSNPGSRRVTAYIALRNPRAAW
jgi:hypothetical protein